MVDMVMLCVTTVRYSVRVNNRVVGPIVPKRGLRQGDPHSQYLFILCVEGLSVLIQDVERRSLLHGCRVGRSAPPITHLLFADDAFLCCRATVDECRRLKSILATYELASGQAIN